MPQIESDLSLRKMKIAGAVLLGQMFATSLLPMMALTLVSIPLTTEFGWTQTQFGYATTALMGCGGLVGPLLGYLVDRTGVRQMIIGGTVIVGLITIAIAFTQQLWHFYLGFGLLGLFGTTAIGYAKVLTALLSMDFLDAVEIRVHPRNVLRVMHEARERGARVATRDDGLWMIDGLPLIVDPRVDASHSYVVSHGGTVFRK
jgi:hypothetical protein